MPKPTPLTPEQRAAVADDIRAGIGRNATARKHRISAGSVSNIAKSIGHTFTHTPSTATATYCARIDAARRRVDRERQLIHEQTLALAHGRHKRARRIEKRITDLNRFHQPLHT